MGLKFHSHPAFLIETNRISQHIIHARINRPEALNAVNFQVVDDLERLADEIEADQEIRVLIFSGTGDKSFISGGDLREFHTITEKQEAFAMARRIQQLFLRFEQLPCWNVAYINGNAYGGGVELMLAFDFRLARPGVKFGMTQGKFYLTPGWGGLTRLVEKVGRSRALQWLARAEILNTESALKENLIDEILTGDNPESELLKWVEQLVLNDRKFIRTLKEGAFKISRSRIQALKEESAPFAELWVDNEHIKRVEDFLKKSS